ncbi:zf-C2HC5-domain-containing protein [Hesseltinella vesiculosa]|uniref:Zf-C2HC5-domain-containing protein n=1 Tax=Hesseltinella vesiculosa TaxID=101127 RepID=A0A1X2GKD8_9FUNG|nr:zf-C2HC5-domain-containing protein [Hesseltinella vesiculosa]
MESWVVDQLSVFLGFDPETLQSQMLPYLMSFESPVDLQDHLQDMLGTSADAITFIEKFIQLRFPPAAKKTKPPVVERPPSTMHEPTPTQAHRPAQDPNALFPTLPPQPAPTSSNDSNTQWPTNFNVKTKEQGKKKDKRVKTEQPQGSLVSDRLEKKKKKPTNVNMTLEVALKELDIQVEQGKKRRACSCQATKHALLTIAPNCLHCGKIICVVEGVGPCGFCGTPVLSVDQQLALIAEAKKKRAEEKQKQHQQMSTRKVKAATPSLGYASKVSGNALMQTYDESLELENRLRAEQHKEKLLDFQRSSAQRTKVIDQASDFMLPTDQLSPWLSAQEKALLLKKQQANMSRLEQPRANQRRVLTIDLGSKQARMESVTLKEEDEPTPVTTVPPPQGHSSGTYARNPLLKGMHPVFVNNNTKKDAKQKNKLAASSPADLSLQSRNRLQDTLVVA